jgi:hypothetical protein
MNALGWTLVAHASNPSYSGGRDQEDHGLNPAWANNSQDPILTHHTHTKRTEGLVEWPEFNACTPSPHTEMNVISLEGVN